MSPGHTLGRYQLERCIGVGGMGDVWLAHQQGREGPVVVKRLHSFLAQDTHSVDRFFDEILVMRQLCHRNVARLLDGGRIGDTYFLAMEFVDGLTLAQCLQANDAPLDATLVAAMTSQACAGLVYAHAATDEDGDPLNLVHRDISPDNLMVDGQGTVRVLDFGLARATCSLAAATKTGQRRGKLLYAAPEYTLHGTATERIDVYSLGVTLMELCTGTHPFEDCTDQFELMRLSCQVGLPSAHELAPDLEPEMVRIIADATQRKPETRLASVFGLKQRLDEFLLGHDAPSLAMIGGMVETWQRRLRAAAALPGSLGQLEPTATHPEFVPRRPNVTTSRVSRPPAPPTEPLAAGPGDGEPKVIVSAELEGVIQTAPLRNDRRSR